MTPQQKTIKKQLADCTSIDRITCKANGSVEARRSYFYRMGGTAEKFAANIAEIVAMCGFPVNVTSRDEWAQWPKTSYFCAVITPKA